MISRRATLGGLTAATVAALTRTATAGPEAPLQVVATTGMIADTARRIGGDAVEVRALMGPGIDPHSYRQTRTDILALTRADLILRHGLFLEAQMEDVFASLARKRPVIAVADSLPPTVLRAHDTYADKFDPHVWMVPAIWKLALPTIERALAAGRPGMAATFGANAATLAADLDRLTDYATAVLSRVPERSRVLVTAHDAFGYFGQAFGFEVLGIQGISTESEAGLNRINRLVDLLVDRRIGAVFVESSVSDRNIRALVEGAAAKGHEVRIGGELYSDAMGPEGSYEGTYVGMIDHNVTVIAAALGADVPPGGLDGRLAGAS